LRRKWGRRIRNLVLEHSPTLGIELSSDSQAAGRWSLESGGEYYAAGVGVGIAGFRADLALIDDPVRSREDADSQLVRDRVWDWYKSDLMTRLKPGGRVIVIQTRWHEDDLAGRILEDDRQQWEVISIPAIAGPDDPLGRNVGDYLWDDDYGYGTFLRLQECEQPPRNWSALFQQQPTPDSGDYFLAEWLRSYQTAPAPETLRVYGGSDYAVTSGGGDYTVHIVLGVDPENRMYVLDLWRGQTASDKWIEAWCDLVERWKPLGWAEEQGQIRAGVGPFLDKRARERGAYVARRMFPTRGDKAVRAQSIRGRMATLGLYLPSRSPWLVNFRAELLTFPAGKHDDQVDALGLIGQLLAIMLKGRAQEVPEPTRGADEMTLDELWHLSRSTRGHDGRI